MRAGLSLLPQRSRRKLTLLFAVQIVLALMDLVAVAFVGILGSLAVATVQSQEPPTLVTTMLGLTGLDALTPQNQVAALGVISAALFLLRTAFSIFLTRRALHFLGIRSAEASSRLVNLLLAQPLTFLQTRTSQEFVYAVTGSVGALILGTLGSLVVIVADVAMLVLLGVLLLYTSPIAALVTGTLLGVVVVLLHKLTATRAHNLGRLVGETDVRSRNLLVEALSTSRNIRVRGSLGFYQSEINAVRLKAAGASAEVTFLPNVSKYVLESAVILSALVVSAVQFALTDAKAAVGALAVFIAAGTRIGPAIMRVQLGILAFRGSVGGAQIALDLMASLPTRDGAPEPIVAYTREHSGFSPSIQLRNLTYTYPDADRPAVADLTLTVAAGQLVALVGSSGAGKSTAADLLLGVLQPQSGSIEVSGLSPQEALATWPGAIGYVPQDAWIASGSFRDNITLGFTPGSVPDADVWDALAVAQLDELVRAGAQGLDTAVGENGALLSGGQRQRLGIARAMVTAPRLVVFDESTSALDAETEHRVAEALTAMRGHVTLVVIAHRLTLVRQADIVVYLEDGVVQALGTFDEVRAAVPAFDRQATLSGL